MYSVVDEVLYVNGCSDIHEIDVNFGKLVLIDSNECVTDEPLPIQRLAPDKFAHLASTQQQQLLKLLNTYPDMFSDKLDLCSVVQHEIKLLPEFTPKRLRAYQVPQHYKEEVNRQVTGFLQRGFIEPSNSQQASPLVVILNQPDAAGIRKLRLAMDFCWVNKYTEPTVPNIGGLGALIQAVGNSRFISIFDVNTG